MKPQEILLASAVIAAVAGVGAALATRAFDSAAARSDAEPRAAAREAGPAADAAPAQDGRRGLDELRMENAALKERMASLEARLAEVLSQRTPMAAVEDAPAAADDGGALLAAQPIAVTPAFVASVGQALDTIRAQEDAEREQKRKELQAQRIEERVAKLQQELGLNNRQSTELRTAMITADDKREALFTSMRDMPPGGPGDGRDMRESFRVIRDEMHTTLQGFLTPEQFEAYKTSEESDYGRRGFGDFGRPPDGGRDGREGDGRRGR